MKLTPGRTGLASGGVYQVLRSLFIVGYVMNFALWFAPIIRMKVGGIIGIGAEVRSFSMFSLITAISSTNPGQTFLAVLVFASDILFIVLAITYPRRWIFILASSVGVLVLLYSLFIVKLPGMHFLLPQVLGYVAAALTLTGFLIRPPR